MTECQLRQGIVVPDEMPALMDWGQIQQGRHYRILKIGYDWILIKLNGKPFYANKEVFIQ